MTYTQNHHLPQWEKSDPIKMSDFNDAMRAIDSGLTTHSAAISQNTDLAFSRLCRAAYDRWYLWDAMPAPRPRQIGAFTQSCAQGSNPEGTNLLQRPDFVWACNGKSELTYDALSPTLVEESTISSDTGNLTWAITFTAPAGGFIERILPYSNYSGTAAYTARFLIRLTNLKTSQTEYTAECSKSYAAGSHGEYLNFDLTIPLHGGQQYRLELQLKEPLSTGSYLVKLMVIPACLTVTGMKPGSSSLTHTFSETDDSSGALVLVRYTAYGVSWPTLKWLEQSFTPAAVRTVTDSAGHTVKEAEYRIDQKIPARTTLTLDLSPGTDVEFAVYHWGVMMF